MHKRMKKITKTDRLLAAELFHHAADDYLAAIFDEYQDRFNLKMKYSCSALSMAYDAAPIFNRLSNEIFEQLVDELKLLGCPVNSTIALDPSYAFSEESQQTRYAWLKLVALLIEEGELEHD